MRGSFCSLRRQICRSASEKRAGGRILYPAPLQRILGVQAGRVVRSGRGSIFFRALTAILQSTTAASGLCASARQRRLELFYGFLY